MTRHFGSLLIILVSMFLCMNAYGDNFDEDDEFVSISEAEEVVKEESRLERKEQLGVLKKASNNGNGRDDNKVIVEPRNMIPIATTNKMEMIPYRMRRKSWGQLWGLSYGLYEPINYKLDQYPISYSETEQTAIGLINLDATFKKNFDYMALGLLISVGYFTSEGDSYTDSTGTVIEIESILQLIPVKVGLLLELDTIFSEPWVVPYIHGGAMTTFYKETTGPASVDGTTLVSYYFSGGLMLQLDWIDNHSSRGAYQEAGIENTFLFVEVNYLPNSTDITDPSLGALYYSGGMKIEL